MEEKKYLGMPRNVNFGLTWLCFIFGIVLLAIEHEKMDREDKVEVVSCFVFFGFYIIVMTIVSIVFGIVFGLLQLGWISTIISILLWVVALVKMILAFCSKEWKLPVAYQLAEKFVK